MSYDQDKADLSKEHDRLRALLSDVREGMDEMLATLSADKGEVFMEEWGWRDLEQRVIDECESADTIIATEQSAGPWHTGEPKEFGRYLIEYEQGNVQRVFIGDYDPAENRWNSFSPDMKVIRWAVIHSPLN